MFSILTCLLYLSSGGHFMNTAEKIRLPDDCTIGYIIESVLGVPLTRSNLFHSHLENLQQVSRSEINKQVGDLKHCLMSHCEHGGSLFSCVAHVSPVFYLADHSQLRHVWKQEQHHQPERGFYCGGRSIKVRSIVLCARKWSLFSLLANLTPPSLISVFQVQVCALSPVPRHPMVSPPGCLLGRPLLSHPRPRPASVSERLVGTSVWY